jgi:hypothetical protein
MNFDLDLNNYKISELEEIFELPPNYDSKLLDKKESILKDNIFSNLSISEEVRNKTMKFLSEAKKIIINSLFNNSNKLANNITEFYNASYDLKEVPLINNGGENFVQDRKNMPYLSSYPSEYFPGIINPLKKKVNRLFLNIDTRFRENYYASQSTNFHFDLPLKLSSVITMQLTAFETPTSYYNISKQMGNNFFYITIDSTSEKKMVYIPDGNYSAPSDLITYLNDYMSKLGGFFSQIYFSINISNMNSGSGQMVVGILSPNDVFNFTLDFQSDGNGNADFSTPLPLKMGWLMGFRNGIYINNSAYVSEGVVDLTGSRYLYLAIDDYNNNVNNSFYSAFNSSILNKNILARISLQTTVFDVFSQNNLSLITYPRKYFGPVDIQKMNIQLLDEYGRILNLNNMDYSFCLTFETVYDI